jgi:hypothetical protein
MEEINKCTYREDGITIRFIETPTRNGESTAKWVPDIPSEILKEILKEVKKYRVKLGGIQRIATIIFRILRKKNREEYDKLAEKFKKTEGFYPNFKIKKLSNSSCVIVELKNEKDETIYINKIPMIRSSCSELIGKTKVLRSYFKKY